MCSADGATPVPSFFLPLCFPSFPTRIFSPTSMGNTIGGGGSCNFPTMQWRRGLKSRWVKKFVTFQQTFLISDINWTEFRQTAANFRQRCSVSILLLNFPKMVFSAQNFALLDENFPTRQFSDSPKFTEGMAPCPPCPIDR